MPSFNVIRLHQYNLKSITQTQILTMYPTETATTLAAAVATRKTSIVIEL